jgi:RNA polymerase sigma factor (sigma-70 family)
MDEFVTAVRAQETPCVGKYEEREEEEETADSDLQLVRGVALGDREALSDLYLRYSRPLLHYLIHFTSDRGVAEELLQDTLVAVWKNAHSYRGEASVQAWLFGIARRRAYKRLRRVEPPLAEATELLDMPAPDLEPEPALLASVARDEIIAALGQLAPIHREVLLLTFVHGLAYAETAGILGVPVGTIKSRLSNARRSLRALLDSEEKKVDQ